MGAAGGEMVVWEETWKISDSGGVESEATVVGEPVAFGVAQDGAEEGDGFGDGVGTVLGVEAVQDSVAEGVEPGFHACGQGGWAGDEFDGVDGESGLLEEAGVDGGGGEEGCCCCLGVDAVAAEDGLEGDADGCDVAVASHFGDETAVGAEGAADGGECGGLVGGGDPVEGCVGEDGVEPGFVGEALGGVEVDLEAADDAASTGGGDHGGGDVDSGEDGAGGGELLGEGSVTTAEIEDALAGLRVEEGDDSGGEVGDEASVGGVGVCVPDLAGGAGWSDGRGGLLLHVSIVRMEAGKCQQNLLFAW